MKTSHKVGMIAGGFAGAFLVAWAAVAVHVAATSGPDRDASSGMYAFGDAILFLAVFVFAAATSIGLGLFYLNRRDLTRPGARSRDRLATRGAPADNTLAARRP